MSFSSSTVTAYEQLKAQLSVLPNDQLLTDHRLAELLDQTIGDNTKKDPTEIIMNNLHRLNKSKTTAQNATQKAASDWSLYLERTSSHGGSFSPDHDIRLFSMSGPKYQHVNSFLHAIGLFKHWQKHERRYIAVDEAIKVLNIRLKQNLIE
jgi:hypothetical protein